jgi:hypothetical protein
LFVVGLLLYAKAVVVIKATPMIAKAATAIIFHGFIQIASTKTYEYGGIRQFAETLVRLG